MMSSRSASRLSSGHSAQPKRCHAVNHIRFPAHRGRSVAPCSKGPQWNEGTNYISARQAVDIPDSTVTSWNQGLQSRPYSTRRLPRRTGEAPDARSTIRCRWSSHSQLLTATDSQSGLPNSERCKDALQLPVVALRAGAGCGWVRSAARSPR